MLFRSVSQSRYRSLLLVTIFRGDLSLSNNTNILNQPLFLTRVDGILTHQEEKPGFLSNYEEVVVLQDGISLSDIYKMLDPEYSISSDPSVQPSNSIGSF